MELSQEELRRFWGKVVRTPECWTWEGPVDKDQYPLFYVNGKRIRAQRAMWGIVFGELRPGQHLVRTCGERGCLSPGHLDLRERREEARHGGR